jgi:hypothetical protein
VSRRLRTAWPCVAALMAVVVLPACDSAGSDGDTATSAPAATICDPEGTAQSEADLPAVGLIDEAVVALEAELGGPQDYFEINATARVVNLFVSLNDGTLAQAWAYAAGALSSTEPQAASGGTFRADDLEIDAGAVIAPARAELPDSILETFYVHGDGTGAVQYGLLASALCGGGLDVTVGPSGEVLGVDPL